MSEKQSTESIVTPTKDDDVETFRKSVHTSAKNTPFGIVFGVSLAIGVLGVFIALFYAVVHS